MNKLGPADIYPEFVKKEPHLSHTEHLLYMLQHVGTPFTTSRGARFLTYRWGDGCSQSVSLSSPSIRMAAVREYLEKFGHPPKEATLRSAFRAFQAQATGISDVHLRIAEDSGKIHLDPAWLSAPF